MAHSPSLLVSIGIPTYNRANSYLRYSLRSAVSQTYKNIEIIVSDNCSSDNTESVVREFNDPRIRYYRQEGNIGPVRNRNFCLEQSQGQYFLLLFDDDVIDDEGTPTSETVLIEENELVLGHSQGLLFFDFAGYSTMAIGLALMIGFVFAVPLIGQSSATPPAARRC